MKSVVEIEIDAAQERSAELFADPNNNPRWMHDIARVEHLGGLPGETGSIYRLVPKQGHQVFVATVVERDLPSKLRLFLDSSSVSVSVTDRLVRLSDWRTKLVSEEIFRFKGLFRAMFGFFAQRAIKAAHRKHMESFKHFAESQT
jgi:hypothetical protein